MASRCNCRPIVHRAARQPWAGPSADYALVHVQAACDLEQSGSAPERSRLHPMRIVHLKAEAVDWTYASARHGWWIVPASDLVLLWGSGAGFPRFAACRDNPPAMCLECGSFHYFAGVRSTRGHATYPPSADSSDHTVPSVTFFSFGGARKTADGSK